MTVLASNGERRVAYSCGYSSPTFNLAKEREKPPTSVVPAAWLVPWRPIREAQPADPQGNLTFTTITTLPIMMGMTDRDKRQSRGREGGKEEGERD